MEYIELIISVEPDLTELHQVEQACLQAQNKQFCLKLDLSDTDIHSGVVMARMTSLLRTFLLQNIDIELISPPQLLLHNLYRVAAFPHPKLFISAPRTDEEAYG